MESERSENFKTTVGKERGYQAKNEKRRETTCSEHEPENSVGEPRLSRNLASRRLREDLWSELLVGCRSSVFMVNRSLVWEIVISIRNLRAGLRQVIWS